MLFEIILLILKCLLNMLDYLTIYLLIINIQGSQAYTSILRNAKEMRNAEKMRNSKKKLP